MNLQCISAIIKKDSIQAVRNRLVLIGLIAGILIAAVYYLLPSTVEETFTLAVYDRGSSQFLSELLKEDEEGVYVNVFSSEEELKKAVEKGDYVVGIVYPEDFDSKVLSGEKPTIVLYFESEQPESLRKATEYLMEILIEYTVTRNVPFDIEEEIIGEDMAGRHIPLQEQSLPLYLLFALMIEMWTISTLIVEESAAGTLKAVLVTPASPSDVILAKGVVGIGYAMTVAAAILVLTWSVRGNLLCLFLGLLLGSLMAVSMGLFLGSLTKSIVSSYAYVSVPMLVLLIPGLVIFIPGVSLSVVKMIPTYYLVNALDSILNYGAGIGEVWKDFLLVGGCDGLFFVLGVYALRRRYS